MSKIKGKTWIPNHKTNNNSSCKINTRRMDIDLLNKSIDLKLNNEDIVVRLENAIINKIISLIK